MHWARCCSLFNFKVTFNLIYSIATPVFLFSISTDMLQKMKYYVLQAKCCSPMWTESIPHSPTFNWNPTNEPSGNNIDTLVVRTLALNMQIDCVIFLDFKSKRLDQLISFIIKNVQRRVTPRSMESLRTLFFITQIPIIDLFLSSTVKTCFNFNKKLSVAG